MPAAGRLGDQAHCPNDAHACPACPHDVTGGATDGSPDVFVNDRKVLRVGDPGAHGSCCGPETWRAGAGAPAVFVNGKKVHRLGDQTVHCGGKGQLVEGSPNVDVGDFAASPDNPPHDITRTITVHDALGRALKKVTVKVFCPHREHPEHRIDGEVTLSGLCKDSTVVVLKGIQRGERDL